MCARAADLRRFEAVEAHMGTLIRIELYASGEQRAATAFRAAFDRIAQLDALLSDFRPDSELNRICRAAVGQPVQVSSDLFQVLAASQKLARETGGAFDVTLGPVIRLWRQARKENRLPDAAALRDATKRCGYQKLRLDPASQTVTLDEADMLLDVGGIAKGYAADAALSVLTRFGIRSAMVAASGDLVFGDPPPGQPGWRIRVDSRTLLLSNAAVSTSGDAEQRVVSGGERYSHIIDSSTGMGLTRPIAVTVVARQGILADGLATAVSVLGPDRGMDFIEKQSAVAALFVTGRGAAAQVLESSRWSRILIKAPVQPARGPLPLAAIP